MAPQTAASTHDDPCTLVDLARYPIDDLDSPAGRALLADGRAQLARDGLCLLHDFVTPQALDGMISEGHRLQPRQHHDETWLRGVDDKDRSIRTPSRNA